MACHEPLQAWKSHVLKTPAGKNFIAFNRDHVSHLPYESICLPCGKCLGCKFDHTKMWAVRCVHEASLWDHNSFITLTFNDMSLYERRHDCRKCEKYKRTGRLCSLPSLCVKDFQNFMKRLRKHADGFQCIHPITREIYPESNRYPGTLGEVSYPIRYYHVGEYGERFARPHHHACLFNFDFKDKYFWKFSKKGYKLFRSPFLEKLWPYGFSYIGEVTWQSAAYVARYCMKKVSGDNAEKHYMGVSRDTGEVVPIEPEYPTMSRRPGIAREWFRQNPGDVYPKDFVTIVGHVFRTPRFYDKIYDIEQPEAFKKIKRKRLTHAKEKGKDDSSTRRRSKRIISEQRALLLYREYEDDSQVILDPRFESGVLSPADDAQQ